MAKKPGCDLARLERLLKRERPNACPAKPVDRCAGSIASLAWWFGPAWKICGCKPGGPVVSSPAKLLFLPGASGNTAFWQPLAARLVHRATRVFAGYPGFGALPADPAIHGLDDLAARTVQQIDQPTALIAQSMGGVIAILAALQSPKLVTHLVLSVTSGGLDTRALGAMDWRADFSRANPHYPDWFVTAHHDLTPKLQDIRIPVLLLWGDADPLSPVAVGQKLAQLLPNAHLHVQAGGNHDLAHVHARELAPLVDAHLAAA